MAPAITVPTFIGLDCWVPAPPPPALPPEFTVVIAPVGVEEAFLVRVPKELVGLEANEVRVELEVPVAGPDQKCSRLIRQ